VTTEREHPEAAARMVDITGKDVTDRVAVASCRVVMGAGTRAAIEGGSLKKGDALEVARIAGIMAAKKTSEIIPLCHPIPLTGVDVELEVVDDGIQITVTAKTTDRTGVEMEALTAAAAAALTVYDMVKGIEREVEITDLRLLEKSGGKSGHWSR
jgi:cyclic pyranopterin monophosphate synthase